MQYCCYIYIYVSITDVAAEYWLYLCKGFPGITGELRLCISRQWQRWEDNNYTMIEVLPETQGDMLAVRVSGELTNEDFDLYRQLIRDRMKKYLLREWELSVYSLVIS